MPVTPTYPGVYLEELPSGVRTIVGVATSITAFIGRAKRGPVEEPILINNYGEFERIFGGLWTESNLGFAVRDFYNNGGSQAVIVRLFNLKEGQEPKTKLFVPISDATVTGGSVSGTPPQQVTGGTATVIGGVTKLSSVNDPDLSGAEITGTKVEIQKKDLEVTASTATVRLTAEMLFTIEINKENTYTVNEDVEIELTDATVTTSKIAIEGKATITDGTVDSVTVTGGTATITEGTATISLNEGEQYDSDTGARCGKVTEGTATITDGTVESVTVTGGTAKLLTEWVNDETVTVTGTVVEEVEIEIEGNNVTLSKDDFVTIITQLDTTLISEDTVEGKITEENSVSGSTATVSAPTILGLEGTVTGTNEITLPTVMKLEAANEGAWGQQLQGEVNHELPPNGQETEGIRFNLSVKDNGTEVEEIFHNVSTNPDGDRYVENVLEKDARLVNFLEFIIDESDIPGENDWNYVDSKPDGGDDGGTLEGTNFTDGEGDKKGIYALENTDLFNLLCIPPYKDDGNIDAGIIDQVIAYCEKRRAMMIIDAPSGWTDKKTAKDGIDGSDVGSPHPNAAIFFPRLKMPNPLKDNQMETFAPCGAVAGIFARTDATRGVWKAPAGLNAVLRGVADLSVPLTDAENGELNPKGINCLRNKPPAGKIIWGSRTRVGDDMLASEWKYIPVRRLALYLQETLYRNTKWAVFEPNDEPLWAQLRLNIGAFMQNLFKQGAFQGSSPKDAYFVKCDKETTTQYDIDRGIVNIVIGFAPLKPAEFVILKFQQIAGQ